jgi:hypothetical protein
LPENLNMVANAGGKSVDVGRWMGVGRCRSVY